MAFLFGKVFTLHFLTKGVAIFQDLSCSKMSPCCLYIEMTAWQVVIFLTHTFLKTSCRLLLFFSGSHCVRNKARCAHF